MTGVSNIGRALSKRQLTLLSLAFIAFAVYGSWVPLNYVPLSFPAALEQWRSIPFLTLGISSRADWVANILLFIPIGFFVLGSFSVDGPLSRTILAVIPTAAFCLGLSLAIEFSQLWFPGRTVSQNDIAAETIGGLLGALLWIYCGQVLTNWIRSASAEPSPRKRLEFSLQAYLLALFAYSVLPLDLTISMVEWYHKYELGRVTLIPFTSGYTSLFGALYQLTKDVILFIPVGALATLVFVSSDQPLRSVSRSMVAGVSIVIAIEFAQLLVYTRFTDTTDIITGSVGVAIGVYSARRWFHNSNMTQKLSSHRIRKSEWLGWFGAAILYATLLAVGYLFPFDFVLDKTMIRLRLNDFFSVPLSALYTGSEFKAISNLFQKVLLFSPLGGLFAMVAFRVTARVEIQQILLTFFIMLCAGFALSIELLQVLSPRHTPDLTDAMMCTAGAVLGMIVTTKLQRNRQH